jgi:hypothetical protein
MLKGGHVLPKGKRADARTHFVQCVKMDESGINSGACSDSNNCFNSCSLA